MKYELQTIPVWKAYEGVTECPLCDLEVEAEERNTTFFLGNSIMAPEMRVELNEHGFCRRHFHMLLGGQGKLGYSLALTTHLESMQVRMAKLEKPIRSSKGNAARPARLYTDFLSAQSADCLMCNRVAYNLKNYAYTIVKLFQTEPEFQATLAGSRGFCLHHLPLVVEMGVEILPGKSQAGWHEALFDLQHANLDRLRRELEEFTWQFDYQTDKKTPPRARDAVPRAVQKLSGPA